jgi:hypothetical protein
MGWGKDVVFGDSKAHLACTFRFVCFSYFERYSVGRKVFAAVLSEHPLDAIEMAKYEKQLTTKRSFRHTVRSLLSYAKREKHDRESEVNKAGSQAGITQNEAI